MFYFIHYPQLCFKILSIHVLGIHKMLFAENGTYLFSEYEYANIFHFSLTAGHKNLSYFALDV